MPEAKPGPVPELRFPEFREAGPWEVKRLGEIAELKAGKFIPASDIRADSEHGLNPCYGGNGLRGFTESFTHSGEYPLIGRQGAYSGNVQLAEGRFHATEHAIVVTPVESASTKFLFKLLVRANLSRLVTGQAQPGLSVARLNGVSLPLPSLPEQQKIAICLGSLEDLIRAEEGRLEALRAHKTGLMQRLCPAPGQTTPRLRFPEFQNAGPWEVKRLGEIAEINPSTGPLPPNFVYIDLESVVGGELVQKKHISRKGAPSRAQRVLKVGDVIYQMVRPYQMNNLLFEMDDGQEYVASTGYAQLRAEGSSTFLYQLIHTTPFTNSVLEKCTGSNYPAISSSDLADLRTRVPALPEQQKIADCLTALDDLIRAQGETIAALKGHKAGLMQKLFPREVG